VEKKTKFETEKNDHADDDFYLVSSAIVTNASSTGLCRVNNSLILSIESLVLHSANNNFKAAEGKTKDFASSLLTPA
jgi:hypothetical protein